MEETNFEPDESRVNSDVTETEVDNSTQSQTESVVYEIPEAYKDCGWAQNIKSNDDLWKCMANAQKLIGRKSIPDFKNASETEIKDFFSKLAPADVSEYDFTSVENGEEGAGYEFSDSAKEFFGSLFKEAGVPAPMANSIINGVAKFGAGEFDKLTDIEDLNNRIKNLFGDEYETKRKPVEGLMREVLSPDDLKVINDTMPNPFLEILYKVTKGVSDKYGYTERPAPPKGGSGLPDLTKEEKRSKYHETVEKIKALSRRHHTKEEKDSLLKELETYV